MGSAHLLVHLVTLVCVARVKGQIELFLALMLHTGQLDGPARLCRLKPKSTTTTEPGAISSAAIGTSGAPSPGTRKLHNRQLWKLKKEPPCESNVCFIVQL